MLQESVSGMSPVPEPMQSRKGEPGGNDEEELNPPTGLALGQAVSSSDDEHDSNDTENETHNGYIPLPQYNDVVNLNNFLYLEIFRYLITSSDIYGTLYWLSINAVSYNCNRRRRNMKAKLIILLSLG